MTGRRHINQPRAGLGYSCVFVRVYTRLSFMMKLSQACHFGSALLIGLSTFASALPNAFALEPRQATNTRVADSQCTNGPNTRSCWKSGWSIVTDFDAKVPPNGITRRYNLEITNTTLAPDGVERLVMAINNQHPGPTIIADWGDTLEVTVKNSLQHNGTSIHWCVYCGHSGNMRALADDIPQARRPDAQ